MEFVEYGISVANGDDELLLVFSTAEDVHEATRLLKFANSFDIEFATFGIDAVGGWHELVVV